MKKLKVYGGMLALVAALSVSPLATMNVFAEEESFELEDIGEENAASQTPEQTAGQTEGQTEGQTAGQTAGQTDGKTDGQTDGQTDGKTDGQTDGKTNEEEILYEEKNDNFKLEDIKEGEKETEGVEGGTESKDGETTGTEGQTEGYEEAFDPNRTDIDPEDAQYNTGREEIPDTVLTEAQRKGIDPLKPEKETPETGTPETGTPETSTPQTGTPETSTPQTGTPEEDKPVPKMGISYKSVFAIGASAGLVTVAVSGIRYQSSMDNLGTKVVKSRRKYRKRKKSKRR